MAAVWPSLDRPSTVPKQVALHLLAIGLLALLARAPRVRAGRAALAASLWIAVSWAFSARGLEGLERALLSWSAIAIATAASTPCVPRRGLLGIVGAVAVVGSIVGLAEQFSATPWLPQATRPAAFFGSRSVAGELMAASLPIVVVVLGRRRWTLVMAVALVVAFLISTRCRAGWAGAVVGMLILLAVARGRIRRRVAAGVVAGIALAALLTPGPGLHWHSDEPYLESLSVERAVKDGRWRTWGLTLGLIAENSLLGVGPGGYRDAFPAFARGRDPSSTVGQRVEEPHNELLRLAAEIGLPGLGFLFWWLAALRLRSRTGARRSLRTAALDGALSSLVVAACVSLTAIAVPTLAMGAVILGLRSRRAAPPMKGSLVGMIAVLIAAVGVGVFDGVVVVSSANVFEAERALRSGYPRVAWEKATMAAGLWGAGPTWLRVAEIARAGSDLRRCEEAAFEAVARMPFSASAHVVLGDCLWEQGDEERATAAFGRALELEPKDYRALLRLSLLAKEPVVACRFAESAAVAADEDLRRLPVIHAEFQRQAASKILYESREILLDCR